jgi:hypothetical protein
MKTIKLGPMGAGTGARVLVQCYEASLFLEWFGSPLLHPLWYTHWEWEFPHAKHGMVFDLVIFCNPSRVACILHVNVLVYWQ